MAEKIEIEVGARDTTTAQVFQNAANNAKQALDQVLNYQPQRRGGGEGGGQGTIEQLKGSLGRSGPLAEAAHIFGGAGPIIGLGLASRELGEFAERLGQVRDDLHDANKNAADVALDFGKAIPFLNGWVSAGEAINNLLTGEKEQIDAITESARLQVEYSKQHVENVRDLSLEYQRTADTVRKMNEETARVGLTGAAAAFKQNDDDYRDKLRQIQDVKKGGGPPELQEAMAAARSKGQDKVDQLRDAQAKAKKLFDSMGQGDQDINSFGKTGGAGHESKMFWSDDERKQAADVVKQYQQYGAEIVSLQKDQESAAAGVRDDWMKKAQAGANDDAVKNADLAKEHAQDMLNEYREAANRIAQTRAQAAADGLRASGQFYAADMTLLKQSLAEKQQAVDEALRIRLKGIDGDQRSGLLTGGQADGDRAGARGQADAQKAANAAKFDADAAAAKKNAQEQEESFAERINQIRMSGLTGALSAAGQVAAFEQKSLEITEQYAARRREILDLMKQATDQQKEQLGIALQETNAEEQIAQHLHTQETLRDAANAPLKDAAAAGNRIAGLMLKQQDIQKEYAQRAKDLAAIANNSSSSAAEKSLAKNLSANLSDEENRAMQRAAAASMPFVNPNADLQLVQTAGGQGSRGMAAAANEKAYLAYRQPFGLTGSEMANFQSSGDVQKDTVELTKQMLEKLSELVAIEKGKERSNQGSGGAGKKRGIFNDR